MTELAWDKYEEAEFFLEKVLHASTGDELRYYLSAFLSATRSVPEVLCESYRGNETFDSWWDDKWDSLWNSDPLFRILGEMRNFVVHVEPVTSGTQSRVTDIDDSGASIDIVVKDETRVEYFLHDIPQDRIERIDNEELVRQYSRDYHNTPIDELCEAYLATTKQIIEEWENYEG